jgi:hypothetical protein
MVKELREWRSKKNRWDPPVAEGFIQDLGQNAEAGSSD